MWNLAKSLQGDAVVLKDSKTVDLGQIFITINYRRLRTVNKGSH